MVEMKEPQKGLYRMKVQGKYGFIDSKGAVIIPFIYKKANDFSDGLAYVWTFDGREGYINCENEMVIELAADFLGDFVNGMARVEVGGKVGCIDKTGQFVLEPVFERIAGINPSSTIIAQVNGKLGLFDLSGKVIVEPVFDVFSTLSDGLALVKRNQRYGFIDEQGSMLIDCRFASAAPFSEGSPKPRWMAITLASLIVRANLPLNRSIIKWRSSAKGSPAFG